MRSIIVLVLLRCVVVVEKKERKTKAEVDGYHRERLVGERIIKGGHARPC